MSQSDGMEIRILDDRLRQWGLPSYQSEMAAAIDLYACLQETVELRGGEHLLIPAGFAVNMANPNIAALVLPRSGLGHKQGLVCGNLVGLIDPDYTGEILISAWNRNAPGRRGVVIKPGDRIVSAGIFKLRNGMAVTENNELKPKNDLAPRPSDS